MEWLAVGLTYAGLGATVLSLLLLPWSATRTRGWQWGLAAVALLAAGLLLPARERKAGAATLHDRFAPVWQFDEVHDIEIAAPPERVYAALKSVTPREIALFQTLTWIRRLGQPGPESILNAPESQPLLTIVARTTFATLAEEPGREIVLGTVVVAPEGGAPPVPLTPEAFGRASGDGFARATLSFRLADNEHGGTTLITETRVAAADSGTRRRFAAYWRLIYPGSALIRRMWLRAIERRALQ